MWSVWLSWYWCSAIICWVYWLSIKLLSTVSRIILCTRTICFKCHFCSVILLLRSAEFKAVPHHHLSGDSLVLYTFHTWSLMIIWVHNTTACLWIILWWHVHVYQILRKNSPLSLICFIWSDFAYFKRVLFFHFVTESSLVFLLFSFSLISQTLFWLIFNLKFSIGVNIINITLKVIFFKFLKLKIDFPVWQLVWIAYMPSWLHSATAFLIHIIYQ